MVKLASYMCTSHGVYSQVCWLLQLKSYNKSIIALPKVRQYGKYLAVWFCFVPSFGRANTATLELDIFQYCPPGHAINMYRKFGYLYGDIIYANYACAICGALIRTRKIFDHRTVMPTNVRGQ